MLCTWRRVVLSSLLLLWCIPFLLLSRAPSAPSSVQPSPILTKMPRYTPPPPPKSKSTPPAPPTPSTPPTPLPPLPPSLPLRSLSKLGAMTSPAILVICYNRADYLASTLTSLSKAQGIERYPVFISQDGGDSAVAEVIHRFAALFPHYHFWQRPRKPVWDNQIAAAWLAQHFKYALDKVLVERNHSHVIILEDDMLFASDFLLLFEETAYLLEEDPTIWCVSSWNDNGFNYMDLNSSRLFRTGYFPGLGWMMRRQLWISIRERWPLQHWDHWMRSNSEGRDCIAPEVSRTKNIGVVGAHMSKDMFAKFVENIAFNSGPPVSYGNLDYLLSELIAKARVSDTLTYPPWPVGSRSSTQPYLMLFTKQTFRSLALQARIWTAPRAHFDNVLVLHVDGNTLLLVDKRASSLLPDSLRQLPPPSLKHVLSPSPGMSCSAVCSAVGRTCDLGSFEYVNKCEAMRKELSCVNCNVENGPDLPCRVEQEGHPNYRFCLIADQVDKFACDGTWFGSRRLCPCV